MNNSGGWENGDADASSEIFGGGTLNYVPKFTPDGQHIGNSQIFDDGSGIGINTITPNPNSFTSNRTNNGKQEFIMNDGAVGTDSNPIFVFQEANADRAGLSHYSSAYTAFLPRQNKLLLFNHYSDVIIFADESQGGKLYLTTNLGDFTKGVFLENTSHLQINTTGSPWYFDILRDEDTDALVRLQNPNAGVSAASAIRFSNNNSVSVIGYGSTAYAPVVGLDFTDKFFVRNITNGILFSAEGGGSIELATGADVRLLVDGTTGNIAIGTNFSSPTSKLHILGDGTTSATYSFKIDNSASSPLFYTRDDGFVSINTLTQVGTELLRVNGDVYIDGKLTVIGAIDPTQLLLSGADKRLGATDAGTVYLAPFTDSTTGIQIRKADNTTVLFNVDTTNSIIGITGDISVTQDISWESGTGFAATLAHANTAARIYTFPDVAGTLFLLAGGQTITSATWQGAVVGVTYGGTGTATNFTQNSIIFAGASGVYSQDNANFNYNASTMTMGISALAGPNDPLTINSSFAPNGSTMRGIRITIDSTSTAGGDTVKGINLIASNTSTSASEQVLIGQDITILGRTSGAIANGNFCGLRIQMSTTAAQTGAITDARGLNILAPVFSGAIPTTITGLDILNLTAASTTNRGIFVRTQSGATNNYGIIIQGTTNFNGFGTTAPTERMTVAGRVRSTNSDIAVEDNTRGFILKDTQATPHYWRMTVSVLGVLVTTDLGTSLPAE